MKALPSHSSAIVVGSVWPGRMTLWWERHERVDDPGRSSSLVEPGARTPPTESNSVSPVNMLPSTRQRRASRPCGPGARSASDLERCRPSRPSPGVTRAGHPSTGSSGWARTWWSGQRAASLPNSSTWSPGWGSSRTAASGSTSLRSAGGDQRQRPVRRRRRSCPSPPAPPRRGRCSRGSPSSWSVRRRFATRYWHDPGDARPDPYLLSHRRHRPLGRLRPGPWLRGALPHADPRRGDQRLHGPARRWRPAELTYNFGVDSYELGTGYNHVAITAPTSTRPSTRRTSRESSPRSRRTPCARAARGSASCATPTATGSRSSRATVGGPRRASGPDRRR